METSYGLKYLKTSKFIIVAPHAGGDDIRTRELSLRIAELLECSLILNTKYYKPTNKKASLNVDYAEDFNRLSWSAIAQSYRWHNKKDAMKDFFLDIDECINQNSKLHDRLTVVHIHGHAASETIGIDIGIGGKVVDGQVVSTEEHSEAAKNTGGLTARVAMALLLQKAFDSFLIPKFAIHTTIGELFAAWSRQSAVQYHKSETVEAVQLEYAVMLRKTENIEFTAQITSQVLSAVFKD